MRAQLKYLLQPRLSLTFWILSLCLLSGYCQPPAPPPTMMDLSVKVSNLLRRFEGFQVYVVGELKKLRAGAGACCSGGGGNMRPVDIEVTKTKVAVNTAGDVATYTIEYKAIKEPRIIWRVNSEPATISDEGVITHTFHNGVGKTALRINSSKEIVASVIVDHVTYVFSFRAKPTKTAEMPLRPTNFYVDAGPDGSFSYTKSKPLHILVSSPRYYPGFTTAHDYQWSFWMANVTAQPPVMEEYPQWREMNGGMVRIGPIRTLKKIQHPTDLKIVYELMTDKGDYDGVLMFSKYYTATDPASVITGLTEMRYVFVSRSDHYDPFPNGFISFVRRDPAVKPCTFNTTCSISCHAVGVIPEAIHLYKLQRDNTLLELNLPKLEVREPYMLYSHFAIKYFVEEDEGDYICSAYSRTSRTDIRTTLLMSEPVLLENTTSRMSWGSDVVNIKCSAKGRPLPKVRVFENYAWQNEMIRTNPGYRLDKTVERLQAGDYASTVHLSIRPSLTPRLWRVICIAENQFDLKATDFKIRNQPMMGPPPQQWNNPPPPGPAPPQPWTNPAPPGPVPLQPSWNNSPPPGPPPPNGMRTV